jgi:intein/homing endonuclease
MSLKRPLTKYEIENILSFITPQGSIPIDAARAIVTENKKLLRKQLKSILVYPEVIPSLKVMIEQQYMETKIQAGESVGVIGAQSIGEKQTQTTLNSVDYTDKILYVLNDKAIVEPIGKMIDELLEKNKESIKLYQNNNTEYLELPEGYFIPSGNENGYNEWLRIEAITRHLPNGKLVKVTTQSGRTVMASQCKSFLVWNGEKFVDTLGSEVKIGDILPTTKNMPMVNNPTKYFDMSTIFPKDKYLYSTEVIKAKNCKEKYPSDWFSRCNGKNFITPYKRPDTLFRSRKDYISGFVYIHTSNKFVSHIPDKILLDNNFGFLIGIYLAEGWCTKTFVGVSNNDEVIRKRVTDFCDCYGVTYHLVTSKGKNVRNGTSNDLKIHSTLLARMFKIICDTGSANKFVPDFAYTAPKEFITGLIDGYFSGDGCVNKTGNITVSSISEQLIQGISFLLSYMGIFGKFNSFQQKKNNVGSQNIKRAYTLDIRNCFAQKFAKEIKMTEGNKQKRLEEITLKKIFRYKCGKIQEKYPKDRDVYFDSIINIKFVEATNGLVYDFTISKTKNFNLFNGLILRDTFHKCGSGDKTVTTGVPRIEELLNATKDPKSVNCIAFMKDKHKSIHDMRKTIGHNIVEISFEKISKSYKIILNKTPENWYEAFKILYGDEVTQFSDCISIKINMDVLYEYQLDLEIISQIISNKYSDMICVFSPDNIGQIDIFVDTSDINLPTNRLLFINSDNVKEIYLEEVVQPTLYNIIICGIPGIKNIYFNDDETSFETNGSNFQELLGLPFIDSTQTISNNVWDIYNILGVEASQQFLIEEFMSIMEGINKCHIQLLVEKMTFNGSISSISRYTMRNEECGPMGKASFEETMDNFLKAGLYGEQEETKGVSASIICGKIAHIGSGVCELIIDVKALPRNIPVLTQVQEKY